MLVRLADLVVVLDGSQTQHQVLLLVLGQVALEQQGRDSMAEVVVLRWDGLVAVVVQPQLVLLAQQVVAEMVVLEQRLRMHLSFMLAGAVAVLKTSV
jgi:hypothetical protein